MRRCMPSSAQVYVAIRGAPGLHMIGLQDFQIHSMRIIRWGSACCLGLLPSSALLCHKCCLVESNIEPPSVPLLPKSPQKLNRV